MEDVTANETCERCPLEPARCAERVAPPRLHAQRQAQALRHERLDQLLADLKAF